MHPFNNAQVIAGQGTAGLEVAEDLQALDVVPDIAVVCTSGGGLMAGMALSLHQHFPDIEIVSAEPKGFEDYRLSLEAGSIVTNNRTSGSVQDALLAPAPGDIGFSVSSAIVSHGVAVTDDEALFASGCAAEELKLVVEPGGAAALASVLAGKLDVAGKTVAVILSGGNIDPEMAVRASSAYKARPY